MTAKTIIYYHRSYRKIAGSGWSFLLALIAVGFSLSLAVIFFCPFLTKWMSLITKGVLSPYYSTGTLHIIEKSFIWKNVSMLEINGLHPSTPAIYVNAVISLLVIVAMIPIKKYKNIAVFIIFLTFIHLVSALFFMFFGYAFPYTGTEFSELCVKSQIGMWIFIPIILVMAFMPLPATMASRLSVLIVTMMYSFVFGALRYIVFLFIISEFSVIYMALLYFAFGPLVDFIYIVGIYSIYNSRLSKTLKGKEAVWKWAS